MLCSRNEENNPIDPSMQANLIDGFRTASLDCNHSSDPAYRPQFVSNNYSQGRKVLASIEDELLHCRSFFMSVAFITMGGVVPLLQTLGELEKRGVRGRILTTDYQCFSEPKALRKLASFSNIELKMYRTDKAQEGFHTKGYIFMNGDISNIIIGSSNMTLDALTRNREWNVKVVSTDNGELSNGVWSEFESLWHSEYSLPFNEAIDEYEAFYKLKRGKTEYKDEVLNYCTTIDCELQPNSMQREFIANLKQTINDGATKALLISATGTGKTYASAFALRSMNVKRALFLVHREQIAKQALRSYRNVFGDSRRLGLLSGSSKDYDADFLFSTMQTMAKSDVMEKFKKDSFDVIVIDEAHRTGAVSYQNIMDYFKPKLFWLGMTASPERTDAFDVYSAFDHNIVYEIRLQKALEENMLCPFHYFGITDLQINDWQTIDDSTRFKDFNRLTSDERVNYVIKYIKYYGYCGDSPKGLVFCSSRDEAAVLSEKFNQRGYKTVALSGGDSQDRRERSIERLVMDDGDQKLDYIFTVDIFNEGVDIPEVNQIIMLRPTESPIVFVQQLGRGLRKVNNKEYVVILDFIGNYSNNFMIPIALAGDRSYNKDNIRRYVSEGGRVVPGSSTIHFDEISKKRIFSAIDAANFSDVKLIRDNYTNLKNKLGRIPDLKDFDKYGEMDVLRIFDNNSLGSYYKFLVKYEKEYKVRLNDSEEDAIEFVSKKLASGKRPHELLMLQCIIDNPDNFFAMWKRTLEEEYGINVNPQTIKNVVNVMTNRFPVASSRNTYSDCVFIEEREGGEYDVSDSFKKMLDNENFVHMLAELVDFGLSRNRSYYSNRYMDTNFVLYQKYTYEDVCRLLEWDRNEVPLNLGGYKYDSTTKTFPVFINYDKSEEIQDTIKYEDHFISPNRLISISKSGRTRASDDVQNMLHAKERGVDVELFVRKNKDDKISKEFYYLGRMTALDLVKEFTMAGTDKSAVEIEWQLDVAVRDDIYEYFLNG